MHAYSIIYSREFQGVQFVDRQSLLSTFFADVSDHGNYSYFAAFNSCNAL